MNSFRERSRMIKSSRCLKIVAVSVAYRLTLLINPDTPNYSLRAISGKLKPDFALDALANGEGEPAAAPPNGTIALALKGASFAEEAEICASCGEE